MKGGDWRKEKKRQEQGNDKQPTMKGARRETNRKETKNDRKKTSEEKSCVELALWISINNGEANQEGSLPF